MKTNLPGTTQSETEALAAAAALIESGQDPFGDDDDDAGEQPAAEEAAAVEGGDKKAEEVEPGSTEQKEEPDDGEGDEDAISADALAAVAAGDEPVAAPPAQRFKTADPADLKTQRDEQIAVKAKALKDLMDGVIEPEEYSRIESEVADKLESLAVQRTLHEANAQTEAQAQEAALDKIIAAAKSAGEVDYMADAKAARQFDTAMKMLAEDGETRTYAELVADAHKAVLAIRGINKPAPAPAPTPAQPRENGKGPMTLRNVPAAETPNSGGGWKEQLGALSGQAYEEAYARLSPGQKAELLND